MEKRGITIGEINHINYLLAGRKNLRMILKYGSLTDLLEGEETVAKNIAKREEEYRKIEAELIAMGVDLGEEEK